MNNSQLNWQSTNSNNLQTIEIYDCHLPEILRLSGSDHNERYIHSTNRWMKN
ncbi:MULTISPECIES: hypothetical protein [unclassified Colwellia]|uniref:hypothetical protein n=1 Tax=unclassified Colwellia TaxID=196834 RepID=UPI0015F4D318|nr:MULTISPECIES: hypothetical protein [unclassified Colwellia]MBA6257916.1 hypothetical protein [Colwellia sp. MB3u-28]MBA6302453.1 hypothetical protein [Colwellia sp. MB02u-14]